jgi:uncharacterized membrane protein YphA (DoxX/SURF4 family)
MKYVVLVSRLLLGLGFAFFGANHILNFWKMPPAPGDAGTFGMLLFTHHYFVFVGVVQLVGGLLLLVGRFVPLALAVLGPVLVNILAFAFLFAGGGGAAVPGIVFSVLWFVVFFAYIRNFLPLFMPEAKPEPGKL